MNILRGKVFSVLSGDSWELRKVRQLLTIGSNPSFLDENDVMYTGLIDFVRQQYPHFEYNIVDDFEWDPVHVKDVQIPPKYLANGDDNWQDRPYQYRAARKAIARGRGIIELATGSGKTYCAAMIAQWLLEEGYVEKVYFIAGTRFLMDQAASAFESRGFDDVGRFAGGHKFRPAMLQFCVVDSLVQALYANKEEVCDDFADCDLIFFDETHHLSAKTWVFIGELCNATYRYGLTATVWSDPFKYSYNDFFLIGLTGGIVAHVPSAHLRKKGYLAEPIVTMLNVKGPGVHGAGGWDSIYTEGIVRHNSRNSIVINLAKSLYEGSYKTLVFVGRVDHGLALAQAARNQGCDHAYFVKGGEAMYRWMPSGRWEFTSTTVELLAELVATNDRILIFGTQVLDEGIDIPSFNALVMATAMKKYRRTVQRAGRGMRPKAEDNRVYIFDFMDMHQKSLLKHSNYRLRTYQLEEYVFMESLQQTEETMSVKIDLNTASFVWHDAVKLGHARKPKKRRRR